MAKLELHINTSEGLINCCHVELLRKERIIKTHLGFVSAASYEHCLDCFKQIIFKKPIDRYYKHHKELMGLSSVIMFLLLF